MLIPPSIKYTICSASINNTFVPNGCAVNFDPADLVDFVLEHDEEITILYDVWPQKSQSVRIDGIAFKKDASEKLIASLEEFRKKISKENKANKGRKYQTKEFIVCRWDKGAFVSRERDFHWT